MKKNVYVAILILTLTFAMAACQSANTGGDGTEGDKENTEASENTGNTDDGSHEPDDSEASSGNGHEGDAQGVAYPEESLEWTIAFGPGGGNDIMARTLIEILEKYELYTEPMVPENREGGSGAVGWGYVKNHEGNPYHISTTSGSFFTTPLLSDPGFNYEDFTHIALMAADDLFFLVPADAPYDSLADIVETSQSNPLNVGGNGVANMDRLVIETFMEESGAHLEYVSFNAEGEKLTALLSGSLDAIVMNPGEIAGQIEAGEVKALAYSGKERLPRFDEVPTFIEEGYEVNIPQPRGIVMPGGVSEDIRQWWIETMKEVAETPEWQQYVEDNMLSEHILYGDDFTEYLKETNDMFEAMMKELGVIE